MPKHVMIATPAHDGSIKVKTHESILRSVELLQGAGHKVRVEGRSGISLLPHARNLLLALFRADPSFTDLVWVDCDVSWEGDELLKLVEHQVDFVAGAYRHKKDEESYPVEWLPDPEEKGLWAVDPVTGEPSASGLIEVALVPGGFVRITRAAVDKLYAAYPDRIYYPRQHPELECCCLYEAPFVPGVGLVSEDYIFCTLWRALGGKVWLDPLLDIHHTGSKEYRGAIASWLKHRDAPKATAEQDLRTLRHALCKPEIIKLFDIAIGDKAA